MPAIPYDFVIAPEHDFETAALAIVRDICAGVPQQAFQQNALIGAHGVRPEELRLEQRLEELLCQLIHGQTLSLARSGALARCKPTGDISRR
jgi:hypothetical protein